MKINMFRFYKTGCVCFFILGLFIIIGSIIAAFQFYRNIGIGDFIIVFVGVPIGVVVALFPIFLYYKQLTYVTLEKNKCTSYSLFKKKLCQVDYNIKVYYSFFDVNFLYSPTVKFVALSNMPFECDNRVGIIKKGFYGSYDQTKIIIIPYDNQVSSMIKLDKNIDENSLL